MFQPFEATLWGELFLKIAKPISGQKFAAKSAWHYPKCMQVTIKSKKTQFKLICYSLSFTRVIPHEFQAHCCLNLGDQCPPNFKKRFPVQKKRQIRKSNLIFRQSKLTNNSTQVNLF